MGLLPEVRGVVPLEPVERREVFVADVAAVAVDLGAGAASSRGGRHPRVRFAVLLLRQTRLPNTHLRHRKRHLAFNGKIMLNQPHKERRKTEQIVSWRGRDEHT